MTGDVIDLARWRAERATTTYYVETFAGRADLLRRVDFVDQRFVDGRWKPTEAILDLMVGRNDFADQITARQARKLAPAAFA